MVGEIEQYQRIGQQMRARSWVVGAVAALVADLDAIDPDIVHGKPDKAVNRGRNQCSSVRQFPDDQAKLVDLTNKRFTSPDHPDGFGSDKAAQILAAVRKNLCPTP